MSFFASELGVDINDDRFSFFLWRGIDNNLFNRLFKKEIDKELLRKFFELMGLISLGNDKNTNGQENVESNKNILEVADMEEEFEVGAYEEGALEEDYWERYLDYWEEFIHGGYLSKEYGWFYADDEEANLGIGPGDDKIHD